MQLSTVLRVYACFCWLLLAHWSADAAEMYQRSHVAKSGGVVRLGDVVVCKNAAQAITEPLLKLELLPAPSPEKSLRLSRQDLQQLLLLNDVDLSGWSFGGAEQTIIVHQRDAIAAVPKESPAPAEVVAPVDYRSEELPATPKPAARATRPQFAEEMPEPEVATVQVVTAVRPISRGELIKASDVEMVETTDERVIARAFKNSAEVVGKEAKRLIPYNWAIDSSYVQRQQLVKRGEQVTICSKAAGVTVTVSGFAKDDGAEGDVIIVTPEGTTDELRARVVGVRQLEIFASGPKYSR